MRADLTQQIGVLQLRAQVAKEIFINLQQVEQALDAFARDHGKADENKELKTAVICCHLWSEAATDARRNQVGHRTGRPNSRYR